jgi:hypothetical protein
MYALAIVGLFTRLDELHQLMTADVRQDPEVGWYIDIQHGSPEEGR